MNDTDKLIQDQFNSLPSATKEAISSVPWRERVRDIAKRESLDADKSLALETETMMILYGFQSADDYTQNIVTEVGVDEDKAGQITKEVSDEILADIEKQFEMIDAISRKNLSTSTPTSHPTSTTQQTQPQNTVAANLPEISPDLLPELVPGQVAHNVPHVESTMKPSMPGPAVQKPISRNENGRPNLEFPQSGYAKGKDPYREPLE